MAIPANTDNGTVGKVTDVSDGDSAYSKCLNQNRHF